MNYRDNTKGLQDEIAALKCDLQRSKEELSRLRVIFKLPEFTILSFCLIAGLMFAATVFCLYWLLP